MAREESLDRATVIRRLLKESVKRWQLERALRGYERGELSIGRAAEEAGLSQWELMDAIDREQVAYPMRGVDVGERLEAFGAPRGKGSSTFGFRSDESWMGSTVITLADVPPRRGGILLVGINPAPPSVAAGHYYQGKLGKRLWARLARLGLLVDPTPGAEDEAFSTRGNGLTDVVKRPSASAAEIDDDELQAGVELLKDKVREWEPGLILFAFKKAASAVLGSRSIRPGVGPKFEGVPTFLLSGPYAAGDETRLNDDQLARAIASSGRRAPRGRRSRSRTEVT